MGLLKTVDLEAKNIVVAGRQARERAIKAMCWTRGGKNYAVAHQDGVMSLWEDGAEVSTREDTILMHTHMEDTHPTCTHTLTQYRCHACCRSTRA